MGLRILHISTRLILGGSQENTLLSCEGQARLGHEVHLAYGPIYGPEGSLLERARGFRVPGGGGGGAGIGLHELSHMRREVHPWHDHVCFHHELKGLLRALRPDVVHTHSSKAGVLGRVAAWGSRGVDGRRPAVVHTIHGPPFMPGGGIGTRLSNGLYTLAERAAARRCHLIVSVADAMTAQFLARGIGRAGQYVTVRSGIEVGPYVEARAGEDRASVRAGLGIGEGEFVVGTVARLAEHKGHDDLLDALGEEVRRRGDWRLLWVGDGWWRDRLMRRVREMGLEGRVVLTGLVGPERVAGLMRAMDVLAHPSAREGLPRTVVQALLCGVCPVAYGVDGTGEVCIEGETGRLVEPGDVAGLRAAVVGLAGDAGVRAGLAARGRALALREFGAERMIEGLEEVYRRALAMR